MPRYELAYGAGGSPPKIPGHSVLIFRMEILQIKGSKARRHREFVHWMRQRAAKSNTSEIDSIFNESYLIDCFQ